MKAHLFLYPSSSEETQPISGLEVYPEVSFSRLNSEPRIAAQQIEEVLNQTLQPELLAFWDESLGAFPWKAFERFSESLDDTWHPGPVLTGNSEPDLLRYVHPLWVYRPDPEVNLAGAINWKLDFRAAFLRTSVWMKLGGLDGGFETLAGAARELGLRCLMRGAVCRQQPSILENKPARVEYVSLADRYRLVQQSYGARWARYVLLRRIISANPVKEVRAWRKGGVGSSNISKAPTGAAHRAFETVSLPAKPEISVVLPTYGRYRYVAEVLDDLRSQTLKPSQILVADGNPVSDRRPELYLKYGDLPLEVIWLDREGICVSRNECLRRVTGDYVLFLDDDSRIDERNLELHLRILTSYGADVSVGPAYTRQRPELHPQQQEIACTFMDCGTTLCRRSVLQEIGGFDMQFNQHLAGEDGELGVRMVRAGALMLNNPFAKRFHYLAPVGGARSSSNNIHRWRRWSFLPRPTQSILYIARRHFEKSAAWDAVLQSWVLAGWRRADGQPKSAGWKIRTMLAELASIPISLIRLIRSVSFSRKMLKEGPQIPSLDPTTAHDRLNTKLQLSHRRDGVKETGLRFG
jgi:glycosyltransferase involved in cell wall biosynthesis